MGFYVFLCVLLLEKMDCIESMRKWREFDQTRKALEKQNPRITEETSQQYNVRIQALMLSLRGPNREHKNKKAR